jgi:hypothetical protein
MLHGILSASHKLSKHYSVHFAVFKKKNNVMSCSSFEVKANLSLEEVLSYQNLSVIGANKNFLGHTLGFVTPWNRNGYEFALKYSQKFTMISPVWYQIKPGFVKLKKMYSFD